MLLSGLVQKTSAANAVGFRESKHIICIRVNYMYLELSGPLIPGLNRASV